VQAQNKRWGPLTFMRELLCLSRELRPTCRQRVRFDVWSHHPYTSGGPTHEAQLPDDASLGDLPEVRRVLDAAVRAGHVRSRGKPRFWVTEFSWDSKPLRVWGLTPAGKPGSVVVEQSFRGGWKRLGLLESGRNGIFGRLFRTGTTGYVRARLTDGTDRAVPSR
jgi:hypothetical protein